MPNEKTVQKLHLHTIESLCNDLIGGHAVAYGQSETYNLSVAARSILGWYKANRIKWDKNVQRADALSVVESLAADPPELEAYPIAVGGTDIKRLRLFKIEAYRFAGIHSYGSQENPPETFEFEPQKPITLFEGYNGSGKTSILNSIIWCLTGQLIRPQRPPELGSTEFQIEIQQADDAISVHSMPPVMPLPNTNDYLPDAGQRKLPVETWVELTFLDQDDNPLPSIRRTVSRTGNSRVQEIEPNLNDLGVDPISFRLGTTMPSLIPFIQIGAKSGLGEAVAELTGLSSLIFLSKHATKVSKRITDDFKKETEEAIRTVVSDFDDTSKLLEDKLNEHSDLKHNKNIPKITDEESFKDEVSEFIEHLKGCKANSFTDASSILGDEFDTSDQGQLKSLEDKIAPAISKVAEIKDLESASWTSQSLLDTN